MDMNIDTLKAVCDFAMKQDDPDIGFFGGEPLLKFRNIKKIVAEYPDITWNITTNATLADKRVAKFLAENNVDVIVSMDGIREAHEIHRQKYDKALAGLENLLEAHTNHVLRMTMTRETIPYMSKSVDYFLTLGVQNFMITTADTGALPLAQEDFKLFEDEAYKVANLILKHDKRIYWQDRFARGCNTTIQDRRTCSAGVSYFGVNVLGEIYPCQRALDYENLIMGNVYNGIMEDKFNHYKKLRFADFKCDPTCSIYSVCNGTCYIVNYIRNGCHTFSYYQTCNINRIIMQVADYMAHVRSNNGYTELHSI